VTIILVFFVNSYKTAEHFDTAVGFNFYRSLYSSLDSIAYNFGVNPTKRLIIQCPLRNIVYQKFCKKLKIK